MPTVFRDKITDARIKAIQKAAAKEGVGLYLWDTQQPGFGVRASPAGKRAQKVSYLVHRWKGREHQQAVIGTYPTDDIEKARREAHRRLSLDAPLSSHNDEKRRRDHAEAQAATLGEAVEKYLERKAQPDSRYWYEVRQMLERDLVKPLGGKTPLKQIGSKDLRKIIEAKPQAMGRYLYAVYVPSSAGLCPKSN
jgi:hypothetical protein